MSGCNRVCSYMQNAKKVLDRSKYRYYPEDFGPLQSRCLHLDMNFDFTDTRALVTAIGTYYHCADDKSELKTLRLDSNGLEVVKVEFLSNGFPPVSLDLPSNDWDAHVAKVKAHKFSPLADVTSTAVAKEGAGEVGLQDSVVPGYVIDKADNKLLITLPQPVPYDSQFIVKTITIARPTDNILEGLYYDYTPEGCPKTIITQCQQYGFQRIVPSIDQMLSKMTYTTTIIADPRYSSFITNGDLAPDFFTLDSNGLAIPKYHPAPADAPEDVPAELASQRMMLQYRNWAIPMATYLFFLGLGSYVNYQRDLEYPDGSKFQLQLLVFPGLVDPKHAVSALKSLHDSILWTCISLGDELCQHDEERARIYQLLIEREELKGRLDPSVLAVISSASPDHPNPATLNSTLSAKELGLPERLADGSAERAAAEKRLSAIRDELKVLIAAWGITGYKYEESTYREIAMLNSNYGGMENKNNTTIIAKMIAPSDLLTDREYVYMEGVKVHEYYHALNGSCVTGARPFEIWLNEAATVFIQRQREYEIFGYDYMRLGHVQYALTPGTGPLAADEAPNAMAIVPEGFNTTHELISSATYSKAPEFVNAICLVLGKEKFHIALNTYYRRHWGGNASTEDWLACMQEYTDVDLTDMADGWLKRPGHPRLHYTTEYDSEQQQLTVTLTQKGWEKKGHCKPWLIPVEWALVSDGKNSHEGLHLLSAGTDKIVVKNVTSKPDFASIAKGWSFFGVTVNDNKDSAEISKQALSDPDAVNRMLAYIAVTDDVKVKVMDALASKQPFTVCDEWVSLHGAILFNESLSMSTRQSILSVTESISKEDMQHRYWALSDTRIALSQAVVRKYHKELVAMLKSLNSAESMSGVHLTHLPQRALKAHVASLLAAAYFYKPVCGDAITPLIDLSAWAEELFDKSSFMSDKTLAVSIALNAPARTATKQVVDYVSESDRPVAECVDSIVDAAKKQAFIDKVKAKFITHPDSLSTYIQLIASVGSDESYSYIRQLIAEPFFEMAQAGHARTVARCWTGARKRSILTKQGLALTADLIYEIGIVNEMSAYALLQAFGDINKFDADVKEQLIDCLKAVQSRLSKEKQQSLYNNIDRIIESTQKKE